MQSRPTLNAEQKLREIYFSMSKFERNAYLDQKIGAEMAPEFISGAVTKNTQTPDVESANFKYQRESFRLIRKLLHRQEYEALGLLLEKCPRISEEPTGKHSLVRTGIDFDGLDESKVASLVSAFNCSTQAVPLNIECMFNTSEGCEKAIKFLNACTKVAYVSLTVKPGDERFLECLSRNKNISTLYLFGFKDCADKPEDQTIRQYLDMLASMSHLEKIELDEKGFREFPAVLSETLKNLSGSHNLKSLRCPYLNFPNSTLWKNFVELIQKLPHLTEFVLEFDGRKDSDTQLREMEDLMTALRKGSAINTLHIVGFPQEENQARFFELVSRIPSVTDFRVYSPQYISVTVLRQISDLLRKNPQIVNVFDEFNDRNWASNLEVWKNKNSAQESCQEFLLICDLIDKNRARATLAETYGTSFSQYRDGEQTLNLSGQAWLPPEVGNIIAASVLDLSPNVKEFEGVMRAVNRSAWEAEQQTEARAGTDGTGNAGGPTRTTMDAVPFTTTTTTTTTTTASPSTSMPPLAANRPASSAAATDGAKPVQPTKANQSTTPADGRIDPGYESDVFIESSDDDE